MFLKIIIFLAINFAALAIGGIYTGKGVPSEWYQELVKAPWTPPGWVFGLAWSTIMVCLALYMAFVWDNVSSKKTLLILFAAQWILNVLWSPVFFYYQNLWLGLIIILLLTIVVGLFFFFINTNLTAIKLLILPYFLWLIIASSLNAYILIKN